MGWTQPQAAERLGINLRTLQRARRVIVRAVLRAMRELSPEVIQAACGDAPDRWAFGEAWQTMIDHLLSEGGE